MPVYVNHIHNINAQTVATINRTLAATGGDVVLWVGGRLYWIRRGSDHGFKVRGERGHGFLRALTVLIEARELRERLSGLNVPHALPIPFGEESA